MFPVSGSRFRCFGFRCSGVPGFRCFGVPDSGVSSFGFGVSSFGFGVSCFGVSVFPVPMRLRCAGCGRSPAWSASANEKSGRGQAAKGCRFCVARTKADLMRKLFAGWIASSSLTRGGDAKNPRLPRSTIARSRGLLHP